MAKKALSTALCTAVAAVSIAVGTSASPANAASCGGQAGGLTGAWSAAHNSNCSVMGSPRTKVTYWWNTTQGTQQTACVQGWGYNTARKGGWYNLGCGQRGHATVPWGSVGARPKIRVMSTNIGAALVEWQH
ncbi:hypothetical protein ACQPZZ_24975 [Microbispora sp. CA-135349]|uniref:hypothetical protein n=1 Tax=Microbispora sp. CA-135349 TaxID=3239953 RepID=UPI003D8E436D